MLDLNTIIPPMVEDIIALEPFYPDIVPSFPLGIFTPLDGGTELIISGEERLTNAMFQIDVYDTSQQRCEQISAAVSKRLAERGFRRQSGQVMRENRLFRRVLTFTATIDEQTGLVYRR